MADPAIGDLNLVGLFKATLEIWGFVDAGTDFSARFSYLRTRLDNQRAIFLIWAERMGFDSVEGYANELNDERVARPITNTLSCLQRLLSDTDGLSRSYGISVGSHPLAFRRRHARFVSNFGERHREDAVGEDSARALRRQQRRQQRQANLWHVNQWAIRDANKFESLLTEISVLVKDLKDLTDHITSHRNTENIAREMVAEVDESELPMIEQAVQDSSATILSNAASVRLRSIEARAVSATSGVTTSFTFLTAPRRQDNPLELDESMIVTGRSETFDFAFLISENAKACACQAEMGIQGSEDMNPAKRRRLQLELRAMISNPDAEKWWTLRPVLDRLDKWLATIRGPSDTPYEGGIFHIRIDVGDQYPFAPARMRFLTKILHPNVEANGAICTDLLYNMWNLDYGLEFALKSVALLLDKPNWDEPVDGEHLAAFRENRPAFEVEARRWTRMYATGYTINPGDVPGGFSNTTRQR